MKLTDFPSETNHSGLETTYTDPDTGAWVKIMVDQHASAENPIKDQGGIEIAYIGHDAGRYDGSVDGIPYPDECEATCPRCDGTREDPERWQLMATKGRWETVASGSRSAMEFIHSQSEKHSPDFHELEPAECLQCKGDGEVIVSLGEYLKNEHGAIAYYESETGGYTQGSSARFVVIITDNEWTDPEGAAKAWADEYASWARGDVYGIKNNEGETCWGFIGDEHAEESALTEFLLPAIATIKERREANIIKSDN